jgi:hypothetical protein
MTSADPNSFANISDVITRHISWNITADFEKKVRNI